MEPLERVLFNEFLAKNANAPIKLLASRISVFPMTINIKSFQQNHGTVKSFLKIQLYICDQAAESGVYSAVYNGTTQTCNMFAGVCSKCRIGESKPELVE